MEELRSVAKKAAALYPDADQVIAVRTSKSNIYYFSNNVLSGNYTDETAFIQMLREKDDVYIQYVVCQWIDGGLDLPSMHFRKLLLAADSRNGQAKILCQGFEQHVIRTLAQTMP